MDGLESGGGISFIIVDAIVIIITIFVIIIIPSPSSSSFIFYHSVIVLLLCHVCKDHLYVLSKYMLYQGLYNYLCRTCSFTITITVICIISRVYINKY